MDKKISLEGSLLDIESDARRLYVEGNPEYIALLNLARAVEKTEGPTTLRAYKNAEDKRYMLEPVDAPITMIKFSSSYDPYQIPRIVEANRDNLVFALGTGCASGSIYQINYLPKDK